MRTGRSLTVCWRLLPGGGGPGPGVVVSGLGGVVSGLGVCGVWFGGGGGGGTWSGGWAVVSQHALRQKPPPPPVDRITDACKNITLAQLRCSR